MANSPTIVAASLSDQDLKNSIDKLVKYVDKKTMEMAQNFDAGVELMKESLNKLGNVKIDFGGSSSGGSSKRTSSLKQEEQQVKNVATSYDGLAKSQQTAIGSRGGSVLRKDIDEAASSYSGLIQQIERTQAKFDISPIQNLRMRQHELEAGMQIAANEAAKAKKDVDELNAAISNYKKTLETLPKNQQGFANRQAIQKEINDLITLRDASVSEQQKWTNAGRVLATQYESVKGEIRQIGQALIDSEKAEKQVTSELDRQLQKISEISSRKEATLALKSISSMESSDLDKASTKLENLKALKDRVKNTDLMSQKEIAELDRWIQYTTSLVERFGQKTQKNAKDNEEALKKSAEAERQWAENIRQRGQAAQETSKKLLRMLNEEAKAGGSGLMGMYNIGGKEISAVAELNKAIKDMQESYNRMSDAEKSSPIGRALKNDIDTAKEAIQYVSAYNKLASGWKVGNKSASARQSLNYENLRNIIKQLTDEYRRMSIEEIKAGNADALIDKIQRTERAARQLQARLSRPISLEAAMRGSEKTLDDIAYKMQRLQAYKQGIDLTKPGAADEIRQVDEKLQQLQKDADKWMSKTKDIIEKNNALGRSWNYMKNRLAFYFTVGASTQFVKNLIEVRSQYEMNERALGILIDSAERGTQIFNELSQMALVSPYTLIELSTAAKQLTAYDIAAKDVVDTTRRLADMAAAVGIPIERLTYALGQIKAYGYLNSRDTRMFANAGIPLVKQLSEYYTELEGKLVSTADVYDRIKKKAIDFNEVMEVINHMTDQGGKFFDFQAKMADTLKVRLANLTLAWNNMLNEMGKDTQGVLTWGIGALRDLFKHWKEIDKAVKSAAWVVGIKVAFDFLLLGLNRAGLALGMWTHKMALSEVVGKRLAATMISLGRATASLAASRMTWITLAVMTTIELISALNGANEAQKALNESIRKGAEDNYNNTSKFLEQYKDLRESLYETRKVAIGNIYDPSSRKAAATAYSEESFAKDIDNNEAKKAWEAIREQIELTTASSDKYIQSLLSIKNMSERIRQGFVVLEDIQTVNSALKELGDETIKVEKDVSIFFGLLDIKDGLINNLKDYEKELDNVIEKYGSIAAMKENTWIGGKGSDDLNDYQTALEKLREDLSVTTDSIINFIELKGWSGDVGKINQVFEQISQKLILDNQLDPQKAFLLQTEVEEARSAAAKQAQAARIKDLVAAYQQEKDEELKEEISKEYTKEARIYNNWNEFNGRKKVEWERFTKWLKEQHISETTAMFRNMDAEDIKSLNFQEGKHAEWVTRMVTQYAKEHKMSYDEAFNYLKSWVKSANQWSVFIPLIISTEDKKSVYDQLGEYDKLVDEADAQIERLGKRIGELKAKKELDKKETEELAKAEQELADAEKSKRDAEAKGGHGKKEKKDAREGAKAQKAAETELQKALKDEIQLIEQVRSQYKKLTDAGVKHGTALTMVTTQFGASIEHINDVLQKNGMPKFDVKAFAGTDDPHAILAMLRAQIDRAKASSSIKPEEIKALEVEYGKVVVDAQVYDTTKITKGLNNELDKLKEEYELAVELDANPELGGMFAEMFDIDLETLPKTAEEYADQYTKFLNKYLKEKGSDLSLPNLLNLTSWDMNAFREQMEKGDMNKEWYDVILKGYLATREARKKETSETIKDYEKLLEKYAEYETKVNKIQNDAVKERVTFAQQFGSEDDKNMALNLQTQILAATDPQEKQKLIQQLQELVKSIAGDDKAKLNIVTSIGNSETKGLAKASFEEFQKSPEWITATGELSGMTNKAINGLIASLEKYKKSAKNLDPKQIKNINNALKNLYKEQRKNNPFGAIANMIDKAKERMADVEPEMESIMSDIIALEKEIGDGEATEEQIKTLDDLKERWQTLSKIGEISAGEWVDSLMSVYGAIKGAIGLFDDLAKAIGGTSASDIEKIFGVLDKAGQGAQIGAAFGGYGAVIGAVVGAATGIIETFADQWSGNAAITEEVEESVRAVKHLEFAYLDLQQAVDKAYGTAVIGAKQATLANKELQLAELQRQIQLEKSRKSKNRDEDKILDLQKQYKELFYEIQNGYTELVDDLMGTDVAGFAENLVSSMIDAFKQGEDYMDVFNKKFDEMIDNMIMKSIVSRVVSQYLNQIWDSIDQRINDRSQEERNEYAKAQSKAEKVREMSDGELAMEIAKQRLNDGVDMLQTLTTLTDKDIEEYRKAVAAEEIAAKKRLDAATEFTDSDIDYVLSQITGVMPELGERLKAILGKYYKFGEASDKNLSALQQGIQGITEDTAGALEGYMNGVSQQVYLQSTLLTQIRDAVVGLTTDAGLGVQTQMLFQLQQSYLVQQSIEGMMRNVLSPSERAFQVELIS